MLIFDITTDLEKIKSQYQKISRGYEKKEKGISLSNLFSICLLYSVTHPIEYMKEFNKRFSGCS
jgi:hypothetical protein